MEYVIITVNYYGAKQVNNFLNSLSVAGVNAKIIVVDNSNSAEEIADLIHLVDVYSNLNIKLLDSGSNLGYMGGLNFGIKYLQHENIDYEWLVLCNNDIIFSPTFFNQVTNIWRSSNINTKVIAPSVLDTTTGKNLNPFLVHRPSRFDIAKLRFLYTNYLIYIFARRVRASIMAFTGPKFAGPTITTDSQQIYASHGSIFIVRKDISLQGFDDAYFLYGEEVTVAEKCRDSGGHAMYHADLEISHIAHSATSKLGEKKVFKRKAEAIKYVSQNYIFD